MSSSDRNTFSETSPTDLPIPAGNSTAGRNGPPARLWLWGLTAGLIAGLVAGLCGEAAHGRFQPVLKYPANWDKLSPFDKPAVISNLLRSEKPRTEAKNTALASGLLGAALGCSLGLAGGLARRSVPASLNATLAGTFAGALTGAVMAAVLIPVFFRTIDPESGMMHGVLTHAGLWVPIGAAAGLAFGIGLGGWRLIVLALLGGLVGSFLGTLTYELINALAFPNVRLDKPIPDDWHSRILAIFCVTIGTALGAAVGVSHRKHEKMRTTPEL